MYGSTHSEEKTIRIPGWDRLAGARQAPQIPQIPGHLPSDTAQNFGWKATKLSWGMVGAAFMGAAARLQATRPPSCLCGTQMDIARIEPHALIEEAEVWTFECPACGHTLRQTFGADEKSTGAP